MSKNTMRTTEATEDVFASPSFGIEGSVVAPSVLTTKEPETKTVTASNGLNLRAEPSLSAVIVKVLDSGNSVVAIGEEADGWLPVEGGFVMACYVS